MPEYRKPPIVEAVAEIRFSPLLQEGAVRKSASRHSRAFPHSEDEQEVTVSFTGTGTDTASRFTGMRISSADQHRILMLRLGSFGFAERAPYSGWREFSSSARREWAKWSKVFGSRSVRLERLGLRYINRIDVPFDGDPAQEPFVALCPSLGENGGGLTISKYAIQIEAASGVDGVGCQVITNLVDSPVPGHFAILLDIDVFCSDNPLLADRDTWELFDLMRDVKNRIFESLVTPKARLLFQ